MQNNTQVVMQELSMLEVEQVAGGAVAVNFNQSVTGGVVTICH